MRPWGGHAKLLSPICARETGGVIPPAVHAGLEPGEDGLLPAYNLLVSDGWLLVVPRKQEHFEDISLSAVCFGGTLYIRHREQVEAVKRVGPLQVLATTAFAD